MKKTAKNLAQMGTMQMLAAVLGGKIPGGSGSPRKHEDGEIRRGTIASPVSHRLFAAKHIVADCMSELDEKHDRLHKEGPAPTREECKAFKEQVYGLDARKKLLHQLFWQSVTEEHPQVAANGAVSVSDGWGLFSEDGTWNEIVATDDKSSIAYTFIARVTAIICGKCPPVKEEDLGPVAEGEEVIGTLDNDRVKALRSLGFSIRDDFDKQLPAGFKGDMRKAVGNLTLNDAQRLGVLVDLMKQLADAGSSLFWSAVRDAVPAAAELPSIGIREGWKVVKCVPKKSIISGLVMTPFGPGISMEVSLPKGLLESLLGKGR